MPRVLVFANDNSTIYNFRRELLRRLVGDGYQVTVALPAHERNQAFRELGCEVVETPLSRFGTNPVRESVSLVRFIQIIRRLAPDVVLTYTAKPNIYGGLAAQFCGVPYLNTVTGLGAAFQSESVVRRVSAFMQRVAYRKSSRVFFQNNANRAEFERLGIVGHNTAVLPGSGVNLDLHALEPYPVDTGTTRFITVSRIRHDKGFDELFAVIRRVCAQRDDVEFHVVGWYEDDTYRDAVTEMENQFPLVIHGGVPQERVHELIAQSHCLLHPSHHEGMANVILEASATGVPSIASDIPGCREAIDDGVTGLLFPAKGVDALETRIDRFLSIPWEDRRSMGLAARQKMATEFDREKVVDRYLEQIRGICADDARKASV